MVDDEIDDAYPKQSEIESSKSALCLGVFCSCQFSNNTDSKRGCAKNALCMFAWDNEDV